VYSGSGSRVRLANQIERYWRFKGSSGRRSLTFEEIQGTQAVSPPAASQCSPLNCVTGFATRAGGSLNCFTEAW
jgi:hypothetical protein